MANAFDQFDGSNPFDAFDAPPKPAKPIGPPQPLTFAEKYVAPLLESVVGSNPQGSAVGRFIQGASDPMIGLTQIAAHAVGQGDAADKRISDLEGQYQSQRAMAGSTGFDPMRLGGNVATSALAPGVAAPAKGTALAQVLRAAGTGAAYNLAQPVTGGDFASEKAQQGLEGAIAGPLGSVATSALARVVRPATDAGAKTLMDSGITLTPGQILGGGWQRAEDAATSIPVLGDFIRDAKNRTLADFNRAAYARALTPIGQDASQLPVGHEGVLAVKTRLGEAYDNLLPKLNFKGDAQFSSDLNRIEQMAATLPQKEADAYRAILDKNLSRATPTGRMDGTTFKEVESNLNAEAKRFGSSNDVYQQQVGDALKETLATFRSGLLRSNPQYADELAKVNQGYAEYARIRAAGASAGEKSGGFMPAQYAAAIRNLDKSVGKGATATGTALGQDLAIPAQAVLPSTVADSGTPLRHAVTAGGAAFLGHGYLPEWAAGAMLPIAAGMGAASLPYTALGQKAAQKILAERPESAAALAAALRRGGPLLGAAAVPALTQ